MVAEPITALVSMAALGFGHPPGDRWAQSGHQAVTKGECSDAGARACAGHVATLTLVQTAMLALAFAATGTHASPVSVALGLGVNAASHYWADRRYTLRGLAVATEPSTWTRRPRLMRLLPLPRKLHYHDTINAEAMDQAWHMAWILPAGLVIAAPTILALQLTGAFLGVLTVCAILSRIARKRERRSG